MTLRQIEKTKYFLDKLYEINSLSAMQEYVAELKGYYSNEFDLHLKVSIFNTLDIYISELMAQDKAKIQNFLEQSIDRDFNAGKVFDILTLIDEGKKLSNDEQKAENYVAKIYHSYSGEITFNDVIKAIASQHGVPGLHVYEVDNAIINGILSNLRQYAEKLCSQSNETKNSQPNTVFNINNSANASSSVNLNISQAVQEAKQQAYDAGLPDEQFKVLVNKLNELEEIGKSKESRGKRWGKAKEVMKWVVEQGIQVAAIVVPIVATCIK